MRNTLVQSLIKYKDDPRFVMLVGDVGYRCMEPLRDILGDRFINCGIAEQNMIGVAAGLAKSGMRPWVYSISPFIYARAFEQIRNDVCFHDLPVTMVGNGAGYGYGCMGGTHHSLEDYGILLTLRTMRVLVPAFDGQIPGMVASCFEKDHPTWIRLGYQDSKHSYFNNDWPFESAWQRIIHDDGPTIVAIGDIAGKVFDELWQTKPPIPSLWAVSEFPLKWIPASFVNDYMSSDHLIIMEDHVKHGSIGESLICRIIAQECELPSRIDHITADSPPYDSYGSKEFHRKQCGLDIKAILERICERSRESL